MSAPYRPVTIDDSAQLLDMSYRLRYQSFCLERLFFSEDACPGQLETDAFDQASIHVGVLNAENDLVGTARVVVPNSAGLPLLRYCSLFPEVTALADPANTVVELSRVCVTRHETRRATDAEKAATRDSSETQGLTHDLTQGLTHDRDSNDVFATLIKGMYQVTKRLQGTHWIIAVEKALRRRIARYGLPFRQAGPEADYFGPVAPYLMSLAELDDVIRSRQYPVLDSFPVGLEPTYSPSSTRCAAAAS